MSLTIIAGHVVARPERPCTDELAAALERQILDQLHVVVRPVVDLFGTVHLWPAEEVPVRTEVRALAAVKAATDSPVHWHGDIVWAVAQ